MNLAEILRDSRRVRLQRSSKAVDLNFQSKFSASLCARAPFVQLCNNKADPCIRFASIAATAEVWLQLEVKTLEVLSNTSNHRQNRTSTYFFELIVWWAAIKRPYALGHCFLASFCLSLCITKKCSTFETFFSLRLHSFFDFTTSISFQLSLSVSPAFYTHIPLHGAHWRRAFKSRFYVFVCISICINNRFTLIALLHPINLMLIVWYARSVLRR